METQTTDTPVVTGTPSMMANQLVAQLLQNMPSSTTPPSAVTSTPPTPQPVPPPAPETPPSPASSTLEPTVQVGISSDGEPTPDDKRAHAFASLRYENKQLTQRTSELEKQIADMTAREEESKRAAADYEARLADEAKRRAALEDQVGKANLAESKEFRERYNSRIDKTIENLAKVITEKTDVTDMKQAASFAERLLAASEKEVLGSIENLPPYVQGSIYNLVKEGKEIDAERQAALEQWRVTQAGISEADARRRAEELTTRRAQMSESAMKALQSTDHPAYAITDPSFVDLRKQTEDRAAAFIRTASEEELANAAAEGVMAPLAYAIIDALNAEIADLRQKIDAAHRLSAPPVRASYMQPQPPPTPHTPTPSASTTLHNAALGIVEQAFAKFQQK